MNHLQTVIEPTSGIRGWRYKIFDNSGIGSHHHLPTGCIRNGGVSGERSGGYSYVSWFALGFRKKTDPSPCILF